MLDIFRGLKVLIRVNHVHIDSTVFRLHYSITVLILLAFSLIITTRQYVGNPIDCIHTKDVPEDVLNTFCWIHSTYTVMQNSNNKKTETYQGYPGVKTLISEKDKKLYRYYQWVCFCLFFQVSGADNGSTWSGALEYMMKSQNFKFRSPDACLHIVLTTLLLLLKKSRKQWMLILNTHLSLLTK